MNNKNSCQFFFFLLDKYFKDFKSYELQSWFMENNKKWKEILRAFLKVVLECKDQSKIDKILTGNDALRSLMEMLETEIPKFSLRSFVTWMRIEGLEDVIDKVLEKANIKN